MPPLPSDADRRQDTAAVATGAADVFALFSFLWAASVLFHIGSYDLWSASRVEVAAALWVLIRPRSTFALAVLMALQIAATFPLDARTPNHELFAALVGAGFLLSLAVLAAADRRLAVDRIDLLHAFAPAARLSLLILYFFATFHKLNADWFDPAVSCAVVFFSRQSGGLPPSLTGDAPVLATIYFSLGFEILIPVLLALRATRHAGILAGMVFHWILATNTISGFYNFSSMLFAMFALFAAPDVMAGAADAVGRRAIRWLARLLALVAAAYALVGQPFFAEWLPSSRDVARMAWFVWGTTLMAAWTAVVIRRPAAPWPGPALRLPRPVLAVVPAAVFLNGAAPHLGLHTTATWAMFSNLRTEGGRSNHLVVPARLQVFDYQRDVVRIVRSSDPEIDRWRGRFIPYFEIRRRPDVSIVYERRGERQEFERVADDPAYPGPVPALLGSVLVFRPYERAMRQQCVH